MTPKEEGERDTQCRLCGWREEALDVSLVPIIKLNIKGNPIVHEGGQESCTKVRFLLPKI